MGLAIINIINFKKNNNNKVKIIYLLEKFNNL